jgi:peroxiredoxin
MGIGFIQFYSNRKNSWNIKLQTTLLIICFFILPARNFAQEAKKFTLVVKSSVAIDKQINIGEPFFEKQYCAASIINNAADYNNGKYIFSGELLYPTAVRFFGGTGTGSFNELLFIEEGYQEIELAVKDSVVSVIKRPGTNIDQEYMQFQKFVRMDALNGTFNDQKMPLDLFEKYLQMNPASYIALFALIDHTFFNDFDPLIKDIAKRFDTSVINTKGFRVFENEYLIQKHIPALMVKDAKDRNVQLQFEATDGKFTLLEFWFASCKWCKPVMKEINEKYYDELSDRVRIIGISTDPKKLIPKSLQVINSLKMKWESFWDYEAVAINKYTTIYSFPGNLLIDNKGNVLGKNIDLSQIELLLSQQINTIGK